MKVFLKWLSILVGLFIFSVLFAAFYIRTPALWVIDLPDSFVLWMIEFFEITCCEGVADLEFVIAMFYGLIVALLLLGIFGWGRRIWRHSKN